MASKDISKQTSRSHAVAPKTDGNPEGKGVNGFMRDWEVTEPRAVVAKPQPRVLLDLFLSMLVLSASFKYRPAPGVVNYLYWIDGQWSLSLIAPYEWSQRQRDGYVGMCVLQSDMTWTITPSEELGGNRPVAAAVSRFYAAFAKMLNTDLTLEEVLPFYAPKLAYYQRLYASALSRSVRSTLALGQHGATSCRDWRKQLSFSDNDLPGLIGFELSATS